MILEEEVKELLLVTPLAFVVVLDGIGLAGPALGRRTLCIKRRGERGGECSGENREKQSAHKNLHGWDSCNCNVETAGFRSC